MNRALFILAVKFLAMALQSLAASEASAGKCYNRYCRTCYPKHSYASKSYSNNWSWKEALAKIAERKSDNEAFAQGLAAVAGGGASASAHVNAYGQGAAYAGHGYAQSTVGEFSSYPVEGNTILGVNAYAANPLVDLNATLNLQGKLAAQLADGAHGAASDTADLANTVYTLESNRQAQIAAFAAIRDVAQGAPPQPTVNTFRFQHTTQPAQSGAFTTQAGSDPQASVTASAAAGNPPLAGPTLESVLSTRCASCHTGAEAAGGLNVADFALEDLKAMVDRVNLPSSDPKAMPQAKVDGGFGPGTPLTWKERHAIEAAYLQVAGGQ